MPATFRELDDPTSEVFRNTLSSQEEYINDKLSKTKKRIFNDKCGQVGDIKTITDSNSSDARNIVHEFFTGKNYKVNTCLCCDGKIGENGITEFERAHGNTASRPDLLYNAVEELWVDNETPIPKGLIFRKFIEKHKDNPIYMLCKKCHVEYGEYGKSNLN